MRRSGQCHATRRSAHRHYHADPSGAALRPRTRTSTTVLQYCTMPRATCQCALVTRSTGAQLIEAEAERGGAAATERSGAAEERGEEDKHSSVRAGRVCARRTEAGQADERDAGHDDEHADAERQQQQRQRHLAACAHTTCTRAFMFMFMSTDSLALGVILCSAADTSSCGTRASSREPRARARARVRGRLLEYVYAYNSRQLQAMRTC